MSPKIIVRGDDLCSYRSALPAMQEGVKTGFLKNISVISCGLYFHEAAPWLKELKGVDVGLHYCLNAEFNSPKWGPVANGLRTLTGEDGFFTAAPILLHEKGFDLDEAALELEAQFNQMVEAGIKVSYLDEHMAVGWIPGLRERVAEFAARKGLLFDPDRGGIPYRRTQDFAAGILGSVTLPENDRKLLVFHPALASEEMEALEFPSAPPGVISAERDEDRRVASDPRILQARDEGRWTPIRWTEA